MMHRKGSNVKVSLICSRFLKVFLFLSERSSSILDVDEESEVPDLTLLSFIDEKQININLRSRYSKDKVYVSGILQ